MVLNSVHTNVAAKWNVMRILFTLCGCEKASDNYVKYLSERILQL